MFESDLMERLSHVHPITPLVVYGPIVAYLIHAAAVVQGVGWGSIISLALTGLLVWTFTEYVLHRFVFHIEGRHKWTRRLHFIIHGNHHEVPDDPTRLVMPPIVSIFLAFAFYVFFKALLGVAAVDAFFAGFLVGYLAYDYTHFAVHHFRLESPMGRALKQYHMNHHFLDRDSRWGVSTPLWDWVFGTMGERKPASGSRRAV